MNHVQPFECKITEVGTPTNTGVNIATVCMKVQYNKRANLEKYLHFIDVAGKKGVHLIVFPEQTLMGYVWQKQPPWGIEPEVSNYHYQNAEPVPGPSTNLLTEYAQKYNMHIVVGMTESNPRYGAGTAVLFNSAVLIGPNGIIGIHRKIHSPGAEKHIYIPGSGFSQYQTPFGKIGMLICYDMLFPESARLHAIGGAEILIFPTAWPLKCGVGEDKKPTVEMKNPVFDAMLTMRAHENQMWLVAACTTGFDEGMGWEYSGHARIIDPTGAALGETLVETGFEEGMAIAYGLDIRGKILQARHESWVGLCLLFDRRPQLYGPIAQQNIMFPSCAPKEAMLLEGQDQQATDVDKSC